MKTINAHQQKYYEDVDKELSEHFLDMFSGILEKVKKRETIKILDIGGGSGYFSNLVHEYFSDINCEIYVIDTTRYDTWTELSDKITFIEGSAEDIDKLFEAETFDIVFAKFVFHHFVKNTWTGSVKCMKSVMPQIKTVLKKDSYLCMVEELFDGFFGSTSASRMIYFFTTVKIPFLARFFKNMGAQSAGVGVCFLSKKMLYKLFKDSNLEIEESKETPVREMKWYMHVGLLLKSYRHGCSFVAKKT